MLSLPLIWDVQAVMTEHFDVAAEPNGWRFILLTT
jgi:hypothetical protein